MTSKTKKTKTTTSKIKITKSKSKKFILQLELAKAEIEDLNAELDAAKVRYDLKMEALEKYALVLENQLECYRNSNYSLQEENKKLNSDINTHIHINLIFIAVLIIVLILTGLRLLLI